MVEPNTLTYGITTFEMFIAQKKVVLNYTYTNRKMVDLLTRVITRYILKSEVKSIGLCRI